ncbi:hypothetical protein [Nonomuraea sp. SYSU D8015]|uniref:hypothetical protein n=1 Tax=Nonomuraea sp. SYSU D8015 TaxID=2593644 RepID=UPI001660B81D|nr:hypothetical protein [Nonomuraea sp. SYSU D8015]
MRDLTHATAERILARALHNEVNHLEPRDRLPAILNTAHASRRFRRWTLAAAAVLLILAGLLYTAANTSEPEPERLPAHVTRLLEA